MCIRDSSGLAFDGAALRFTRAVEATSSTEFSIDATDPGLSFVGGDFALADLGVELPEVARSIADGNTFLRFQLVLDGLFDDVDSGTSFRELSIDEVEIVASNAAFLPSE